MTRLKVGMVGVGRMGSLHLRKFAQMPEVEISGIYDTHPGRGEELSVLHGVRAFADLDDLFFESDAVCIASPTPTHFPIAKRALEAGLHCLVEKPIAEDASHGDTLVASAAARNLVLQVGFVERFRFEALTRGQPVRPPQYVESHRFAPVPGREKHIDVVSDVMIHDIDLVLALVGEEPSLVSGVGAAVITPYYDLANVRLEFPGGAVANINASRISPSPMRTIRIFSSEAYTSIDFLTDTIEVSRRSGTSAIEKSRAALPQLDALLAQARAFVAAIREGTPPLVSGRDGVAALRCSQRICESIAQRAARKTPASETVLETSV